MWTSRLFNWNTLHNSDPASRFSILINWKLVAGSPEQTSVQSHRWKDSWWVLYFSRQCVRDLQCLGATHVSELQTCEHLLFSGAGSGNHTDESERNVSYCRRNWWWNRNRNPKIERSCGTEASLVKLKIASYSGGLDWVWPGWQYYLIHMR